MNLICFGFIVVRLFQLLLEISRTIFLKFVKYSQIIVSNMIFNQQKFRSDILLYDNFNAIKLLKIGRHLWIGYADSI